MRYILYPCDIGSVLVGECNVSQLKLLKIDVLDGMLVLVICSSMSVNVFRQIMSVFFIHLESFFFCVKFQPT